MNNKTKIVRGRCVAVLPDVLFSFEKLLTKIIDHNRRHYRNHILRLIVDSPLGAHPMARILHPWQCHSFQNKILESGLYLLGFMTGRKSKKKGRLENAQVWSFFATVTFQFFPKIFEFLNVQMSFVIIQRNNRTVPFFDVSFGRAIIPFDMKCLKSVYEIIADESSVEESSVLLLTAIFRKMVLGSSRSIIGQFLNCHFGP